jgi:hypothetical protein
LSILPDLNELITLLTFHQEINRKDSLKSLKLVKIRSNSKSDHVKKSLEILHIQTSYCKERVDKWCQVPQAPLYQRVKMLTILTTMLKSSVIILLKDTMIRAQGVLKSKKTNPTTLLEEFYDKYSQLRILNQ